MDDLKKNNNVTEDTNVTRLPLTSDYVFKRVFAREENNSMLKDFLEAILNIHINKVEVKNPELTPNMADEKLGILDLKLDIDNERVVDVEMQVSNEHNIKERSSTYLSKLAAEQLKVKQNYKELKKIITINILKYNYLFLHFLLPTFLLSPPHFHLSTTAIALASYCILDFFV